MRLELHYEALAEYEAAAVYLSDQQEKLGLSFVECVEAALQVIETDPGRHPFFEEDVRRCLTRVFPYAVLYTIEPDFIHVITITHCAREPGYWKNRLLNYPTSSLP